MGCPFGDECRQNLLPVGRVAVEPVSADIHADVADVDHDRGSRLKFQPGDVDAGENRGRVPSFVTINPGMVLVDRILCDGRSSVVR